MNDVRPFVYREDSGGAREVTDFRHQRSAVRKAGPLGISANRAVGSFAFAEKRSLALRIASLPKKAD